MFEVNKIFWLEEIKQQSVTRKPDLLSVYFLIIVIYMVLLITPRCAYLQKKYCIDLLYVHTSQIDCVHRFHDNYIGYLGTDLEYLNTIS